MTKQIQFFDTTLRDGEQTIGVNFSIDEKVAIAKQLENWGVDVIEAGFPVASEGDFEAVQAVSRAVKKVRVTGLRGPVKVISMLVLRQPQTLPINKSMFSLPLVRFTATQNYI